MTDLVEMTGVTKRFPGVVALKNMQLSIRAGEVHGLIGENGAGKSTLIKIMTGVHAPDEGSIRLNGHSVQISSPAEAMAAGIACVYQELNIVRELSLTDNMFINKMITGRLGLLDYSAMNARATEVMESLGQHVDVTKPAFGYGMGVLQMVEIGKALLQDVKLIIMDEPTSSLGEREVEELFKTVRTLREAGVAILFISHKLDELFQLCDRVTVMRDGQHVLTADIGELDNDKLVTAMVGRTLESQFPKVATTRGPIAVEFEDVTSVGTLRGVSFRAYYGEILGFAGLVGAGRTETMRALFGDLPIDSGTVRIDGEPAHIRSPQDAVARGIAFSTEDRKGQGLVLNQSVATNLILANLIRFAVRGLLDSAEVARVTASNITDLQIRTPDGAAEVGKLSGGNQQKVVIGKWMNSGARIYVFDEPTRGIDVGAKVEVYNIMNRLVREGNCVIMVSSELPEVLGMSDRVIVMRGGTVMAEIDRGDPKFNDESVMFAAWGEEI